MVFSFFKKPPEKMVAKPSVAPRSKESGGADVSPAAAEAPKASPELSLVPLASDFSDFVFSEALQSFQVEAQADPVAADAEEAAMLYANRQDDVARAVLESAIHNHAYGPGERLWLMLFDLYRFRGDRAAFEALELDYAQCFEKSPPTWRDKSGKTGSSGTHVVAPGATLFLGDLVGENARGFSAVEQALAKNARLKLDLCNVKAVDSAGCARLLEILQQARKRGGAIELLGRDALGTMLQAQVVLGVAENQASWLFFLELCQLQGQQEIFEDVAVDYAVTFEVSPPSWEAARVAAPEPEFSEPASADGGSSLADAYVLEGESSAGRFSDLLPYAESRDSVVIDCSNLVRMDFVSAGALLNVLGTIRQTGKPIIFHQPNRLVAELFGIVGLTAVANLVFAKY